MIQASSAYQSATPFPHVVFDDFVSTSACREALQEFKNLDDASWKGYVHVNERKFSHTRPDEWGAGLQHLLNELNSERFTELLSRMTGIEQLIPDPSLEGGGLHRSGRNGFLNVHADFTVHPHQRNWSRRVNLLLYLNEEWDESYGGALELWSRDMKQCVEEVEPLFNRAVIFSTDKDSFHGHPTPMTCPEHVYRRSLALYYFTVEEKPLIHSTNYRARPEDGLKKIPIFLDRKLLQGYDWAKRKTGVSDDQIHRAFEKFDRLRQRFGRSA